MWFEDLKNINEEKMIDSLPISLNYFGKEYGLEFVLMSCYFIRFDFVFHIRN